MRMVPTAEAKLGTLKAAFLILPDPNLPAEQNPYTDYDHMKQYAGKVGHIVDRQGSPKRPASLKMAVYYSVRLDSGEIIEKVPGRLVRETV